MTRHLNSLAHGKEFKCAICEKQFTRGDNLDYHMTTVHKEPGKYKCGDCPAVYTQNHKLQEHIQRGNHYITYDCECCNQQLVFKSYACKEHHIFRKRGKDLGWHIIGCTNVCSSYKDADSGKWKEEQAKKKKVLFG